MVTGYDMPTFAHKIWSSDTCFPDKIHVSHGGQNLALVTYA